MKRIFLDVDGVLADFVGGVLRAFPLPHEPHNTPWDFIPDDVWPRLDAAFWAGLDVLPDARALVELCQQRGELYLLTALPRTNRTEAVEGKLKWVGQHFPQLANRTILCVGGKASWATADAVLIDDHDGNVDAFRAAGGNAILVPRSWNCGGHDAYSWDLMRSRINEVA